MTEPAKISPTLREYQEAYEQWVKTGTVTPEYMRKVLGDPLETVCAFRLGPNDLPSCMRCGEPCEPGNKFCSETCALNNMVSTEPWRIPDV